MPSYPRGWDYFSRSTGTGALPNLALPAIVGVAHALTAVSASVLSYAAGAAAYSPEIDVYVGGVFYCSVGSMTTAGVDIGTLGWSGLIVTAPGQTLGVGFIGSAPTANFNLFLEIQGYEF